MEAHALTLEGRGEDWMQALRWLEPPAEMA